MKRITIVLIAALLALSPVFAQGTKEQAAKDTRAVPEAPTTFTDSLEVLHNAPKGTVVRMTKRLCGEC